MSMTVGSGEAPLIACASSHDCRLPKNSSKLLAGGAADAEATGFAFGAIAKQNAAECSEAEHK